MKDQNISFLTLLYKTIVAHTVTYFAVGLAAFVAFDYATAFTETSLQLLMRPTDDPWVAMGPLFQPLRGVLFALAFYPLREILFGRKNGWLIIWLVLVTIGIFSTFGPAPGSIEGLIYTTIPIAEQLGLGMIEVIAQAGLFAALLYFWVNHSEKRWLTILLLAAFAMVVLFAVMGALFARPAV